MYKWLVLGAIEFLESLDSAVKVAVVIHSFLVSPLTPPPPPSTAEERKDREEGLGKRLLLN